MVAKNSADVISPKPEGDRLKSPRTNCKRVDYTLIFARTSGGLRGRRNRQEADDAFAVDDDGENQVLHFGAQPASIPYLPSVVPAHQFIEFPLDGWMFFANLFVLVARRSF